MRLKMCINIGKECGLTTLGEAYDNVNIHSINLFSYYEIEKELAELRSEILKKYNQTSINKWIDDIKI